MGIKSVKIHMEIIVINHGRLIILHRKVKEVVIIFVICKHYEVIIIKVRVIQKKNIIMITNKNMAESF
jgi:hypothetical protein